MKAYIEAQVIPQYAAFDKAHREDHARAVIGRALEMGKRYDIDPDMLYAAAACHDLGLSVDRKTHHLESGRIIRADAQLRRWLRLSRLKQSPRRQKTIVHLQLRLHEVFTAPW